jgi:hypothetical protein
MAGETRPRRSPNNLLLILRECKADLLPNVLKLSR